MTFFFGFSVLDMAALLLFIGTWICFEVMQSKPRWYLRSITYHMDQHRVNWMKNMVRRDPQVLDGLIQGALQQGIGFFASTSILVVGALIAGLGASEQAIALLEDLPMTVDTTRTQWEIKVLLLLFTFIFAFFKFAWSLRLNNYVIILVGASPQGNAPDDVLDRYAERVAKLNALSASHFTTGLNAYFFALAAMGWFIHPLVFIAATIWVVLVLSRRAYRSKFMRILTEPTATGAEKT